MNATKLYQSILVAYDGTPAASRIVDMAMTLAQNLGARLTVFGVVPPLSAEAAAEGAGLEHELQFRPHIEAEMKRVAELGKTLSIEVTTETIDGEPDITIERRAQQDDVDLVIVGHRTLGRIHRWLEGQSTAEALVKHAKTAVLVVPEEDAP